MIRYYFFLLLHLLLLPSHAQNIDHPNIIFITVDDLGWADLGCYGADLHETPNIDTLARTSTLFTNSYAAAPVCSPTRASIMTGKTPANLQLTIWIEAAGHERKARTDQKLITPQTIENLPLEEITLAELLRQKGYLTAHIGKWHLGDLMHFPETQGFDVSFAASQRGAPPTFFYPYRGEAFGEFRFVTDMATDANHQYFSDREGEYLTDRLTDEAIRVIGHAKGKPLFLNLNYYSVHTPIEAKEEDVQYFQDKKHEGLDHQNVTYAAMVKSIDDNVGRIIAHLKALDIFQNSMLILTSDNGGYINKYRGTIVTDNTPLRSGKGSLYEGGIRIPTIISAPFFGSQPANVDVPISTIDYVPTLCEMIGMEMPEGIEGSSFLNSLKGIKGTLGSNRNLFWHYPHYYHTTTPVSAIRCGDWKLLEFFEDNHIELYNLKEDVGEKNNMEKANPEKAKELLQSLSAWREEVNAPMPRSNPEYPKNRK
ncbi:MAG: sulfatase [Saprospiraceae bacterium]|nr:sulfatase [Saprospiraceae bacterium]